MAHGDEVRPMMSISEYSSSLQLPEGQRPFLVMHDAAPLMLSSAQQNGGFFQARNRKQGQSQQQPVDDSACCWEI